MFIAGSLHVDLERTRDLVMLHGWMEKRFFYNCRVLPNTAKAQGKRRKKTGAIFCCSTQNPSTEGLKKRHFMHCVRWNDVARGSYIGWYTGADGSRRLCHRLLAVSPDSLSKGDKRNDVRSAWHPFVKWSKQGGWRFFRNLHGFCCAELPIGTTISHHSTV